jgi:prepilin peptidase CpaA
MTEAAVLIFFPVLMVYAALSDAATMKISNMTTLALAAGFAPIAFMAGATPMDMAWHLTCALAVFVLTYVLFGFRLIGGGDAKLASATALWLGWDAIANFGVTASIIGGFLTIGLFAARKLPLPAALLRREWIARLYNPTSGVPYGIALAAAGLLVYPESLVWLKAASA